MTSDRLKLAPKGFLWGTAISAHQSEGDNLSSDCWLLENVSPTVPWDAVLQGQNVLRLETGRFVLACVVFLAGALVIFSRREFAYGQD